MEKIARFINLFGSILVLNVIFILTSALTLGVGMGTAWSALIATYLDLATDDTGYYIRNYFKHFKGEFKETVLVNVLLLLVIVGAYFLLTLINHRIEDGSLKTIAFVVSIAVLVEIAMVASFFYPVSVKFEGDMMHHLYLAFLFAHRYFYLSLLFAAMFIGSLYLCVYVSFAFAFICYGGVGFIEAKILKYLWRNYTYEQA